MIPFNLQNAMMTDSAYLAIFKNALARYCRRENRGGYQFGIFAKFRHSASLYPRLASLQEELESPVSENEKKKAVCRFLRSPETTFHNHSFSLYLLDELVALFPEQHWETFYPANKKLVFYSGNLYKGMQIGRSELNQIFENGLMPQQSSTLIDDYVNDDNLCLGITMSKRKESAIAQATGVSVQRSRDFVTSAPRNGYLLKVNYQGKGGLDILETLKQRGKQFGDWVKSGKNRIAVIDKIPASHIEGAWFVSHDKGISNIYIPNKNYEETFSPFLELPTPVSTRLEELFSPKMR
ncbi:MAG: hypothetical protein HKM04_07085 [Legionellales bacterium]|nr:hypothetical protein [Legionellales bacterium]